MWGLELVKDPDTKTPFENNLNVSWRIILQALKKGLVIYPVTGCVDGISGDGILISPPLIITKEQIDNVLELLMDTLSDWSEVHK